MADRTRGTLAALVAHAEERPRFWDDRRVRKVLAAALGVSALLHIGLRVAFGPWHLFPEGDLEIRDTEGDIGIPIEMLEGTAEPVQAAEPPPPAPETPGLGEGETAAKPAPRSRDAGPDEDGGARDGGDADSGARDAGANDAGLAAAKTRDAGAPSAAPLDAGRRDGGDEGGGDGGDGGGVGGGEGLLAGAGANLAADKVNVQLLVNMAAIRQNPVGARMGPLLSIIPQWDDFIAGTHVDPIRDTDWVLVTGPSLVHTEKDVILVHYSAPDAVVDSAVAVVAKKWVGRGGPFDAGVPGVKASLAHADFAERVFLRAQSHVLAVVPPFFAHTAAETLKRTKVWPTLQKDVAMRLILLNPHRPIPAIPDTVSRLTLQIATTPDGGAKISGEGTCDSSGQASLAASSIARTIASQNSLFVSVGTQNILGGAKVGSQGNKVTLEIPASPTQIEATVSSIAALLGGHLEPAAPPPAAASPNAAPAPSGAPKH